MKTRYLRGIVSMGAVVSLLVVACSSASGPPSDETPVPQQSCTGCTDSFDYSTCRPIATQNNNNCGSGGRLCQACDAGQMCQGGECVVDQLVCSKFTCPTGCCNGNTCVPYEAQTDASCGLSAMCKPCDPGLTCQFGTCAAPPATCDASTCSGCCDGTTCVLISSENAGSCGKFGAVCGACPLGQDCVNGTCQKGSAGCSPATCTGCCQGDTCVTTASQTDASCGKGGASCSACSAGHACSAGVCSTKSTSCSPSSCGGGCCDGTNCRTDLSWDSCSAGGTACLSCDPMALCTKPGSCDNGQWDPNALIDLYIEAYSVSEAQCSDPIGKPDPKITFTIGGQSYPSGTCNDAYSCTFTPAWKIPNVTLAQFKSGGVKFTVVDVDETVDDPCWSGSLSVPVRNFSSLLLKPGDGSLTYHVRPAGF